MTKNTLTPVSASDNAWPIRAVQLDLARQRETIPTILQFIDDAKTWGYNTVHLYLEGVIRTPSFPYRDPEQSYSEDDIRRVVAHANERGIELIPCVNVLGHAEHFLSCPELAHLREQGSTFPLSHTFCPQQPEVHTFVSQYLKEIAALFPSKHFNIGCDEAWSLGTCPRCRATGKGYYGLLVEYITYVHELMASLGKRVWIWDDMFEEADEATLARLPRDIVMCAWHYDPDGIDLDGPRGHFNGQHRRNWLAVYEKLGFDVLICPYPRPPVNLFALTRYGRQHNVLGGLMTLWDTSKLFLPHDVPGLALAGRYWARPELSESDALREQVEALLPDRDETTRQAFIASMCDGRLGLSIESMREPLKQSDLRALEQWILLEQVLGNALRERHDDLIEAQHVRVRQWILRTRMRAFFVDRIDPRLQVTSEDTQAAERWCRAEIESLRDLHREHWQRYRPGITPDRATASFESLLEAFDKQVADTAAPRETRAMLVLVLVLPDPFAAARLNVTLKTAEASHQLYSGTFKPADNRPDFYELRLPLPRPTSLESAKVDLAVNGYGGQGVAYVQLVTSDCTLVPAATDVVEGQVSNPKAVCRDDATYCYLGDPDTVATLHERREEELSTLAVTLAPSAEASSADLATQGVQSQG